MSEEKKQASSNEVQNILNLINQNYTSESDSEWLSILIGKYYHPNRYKTKEEVEAENKPMLLGLFSEFLVKHKLSEVRKKNFRVVQHTLTRYELYMRVTKKGQKDFILDVGTATSETFRDMWDFSENEYQYYELYPSVYKTIPEERTPQPRGKNTLIDYFSRIRTFFLWYFDNKLAVNRLFDKFPIEGCKYETPIYVNFEERDRIFSADFSTTPQLEIQRDTFIFQTLIGCRVSDLYRMTRLNVVSGAAEYMQRKTREGDPVAVHIPSNDEAKEILERCKDHERKPLPFISEQKYNEVIERIFKPSGMDRIVTILDPLTRGEVKKLLYEVVSSRFARHAFIDNIYEKMKDPNLVSILSGHKKDSKAFRRYRGIDEGMKKDPVKPSD